MDWASVGVVLALGALAADFVYSFAMEVVWSPFYFQKGILIWHKEFPADPLSSWLPSTSDLQDQFRGSPFRSTLFRQIEQDRYAFRQKHVEIGLFKRYGPWGSGILHWDFERRQVRILKYLDWVSLGLWATMGAGILLLGLSHAACMLQLLATIAVVAALAILLVTVTSLLLTGRGFFRLPTIYDEIGRYAAARWSEAATAIPHGCLTTR